jgi:hypothetical protein
MNRWIRSERLTTGIVDLVVCDTRKCGQEAELNPLDLYAVEEAVRVKEKDRRNRNYCSVNGATNGCSYY